MSIDIDFYKMTLKSKDKNGFPTYTLKNIEGVTGGVAHIITDYILDIATMDSATYKEIDIVDFYAAVKDLQEHMQIIQGEDREREEKVLNLLISLIVRAGYNMSELEDLTSEELNDLRGEYYYFVSVWY